VEVKSKGGKKETIVLVDVRLSTEAAVFRVYGCEAFC
jgi:hypothetical protein